MTTSGTSISEKSSRMQSSLPELQLPVSPQDTLQVAAVVTDVYGRQGVYSDIPCVLEDGELTWPATPDLSDHDPAHWQYGG